MPSSPPVTREGPSPSSSRQTALTGSWYPCSTWWTLVNWNRNNVSCGQCSFWFHEGNYRTRFIIPPTEKQHSLDSEGDFCFEKHQSPIAFLFRTTLTQMITLHELLIPLGSNHFLWQEITVNLFVSQWMSLQGADCCIMTAIVPIFSMHWGWLFAYHFL